MKKIILFLLFVGLLQAQDTYKVVYDLTTGNMKTLELRLFKGIALAKEYYQNKGNKFEAAVVIHGGAYKFFLKDLNKSEYKKEKDVIQAQATIKAKLDRLVNKYHIKFLMCNVGATAHNLKRENIYDFVKMAPNAAIGVINLQHQGYNYVFID